MYPGAPFPRVDVTPLQSGLLGTEDIYNVVEGTQEFSVHLVFLINYSEGE